VDPPAAPAVAGELLPATVVPVDGVDVPPAVEVEGDVDVLAALVVDGVEGVAEVDAVEEVDGVVLPEDVLLPDDEVVEDEGLVEVVEALSFLPHAASAAATASTSASLFMDVSRADDGLAFWKRRPAGTRRTPARRRTRIRPTWSWVRAAGQRDSQANRPGSSRQKLPAASTAGSTPSASAEKAARASSETRR
jgi:hypothetical protein